MNKGISLTAEIFSTFRTKHSNIGLQSRENSNVRYRKNKQKKAYIEWRCFQDKSHNCKAKFFTNITLKECWNLHLDHICGSDLLGTQQTQGKNLKNEIKGKTQSQEKSKVLLGMKRLQEITDHSRSSINNYNTQRVSKHEKKHLEKRKNLLINVAALKIDESLSRKSSSQLSDENQKCILEESHIQNINASRMQILTQNSNQHARPQQYQPLNSQSPDSHHRIEVSNITNDNDQGDDQSRSDFIEFQKYSNQNRTQLQRLTLAQNLPQSQQPTRESSNTDVQNSSGQDIIQITTDHNPKRTLKFIDDDNDVHNFALNKQYLIAPDIKNDITNILTQTLGTLDQPNNVNNGLQMECTYYVAGIPKRKALISVFDQEDDSFMKELSVDYFLKVDGSSSDPSYDSYDYGLSHNFWNKANEEKYATFLREDGNYDFIEKKSQ